MNPINVLIGLAIVAGLLFQILFGPYLARRRLRDRLKASFGQPPKTDPLDEIDMRSVRYYSELKAKLQAPAVDDITWSDLDMDKVFQRLNRTQSDVGEQILYASLRDTAQPDAAIAQRIKAARALSEDRDGCIKAMMRLAAIGKRRHHHSADCLFQPEIFSPGREWMYIALAAAPLLALIAGIWLRPMMLVGAALFAVNVLVYVRTGKRWEGEVTAVSHLCCVAVCAQSLAKLHVPALAAELAIIRDSLPQLKPLLGWAQRFTLRDQISLAGIFMGYLRVFLQSDMISLNRLSANLVRHNAEMNRVFEAVGMIDTLCGCAWVRVERGDWCEPVFHGHQCVDADELVHPLLKTAGPNSIHWAQNVLVTGSNASGKSTFTKAMAISAITAQTLGLAFAKAFAMPRARVLSSMAVRDDVLRGESYFVAEVRSLKRISDAATGDGAALCFIDEILRGTNTVERLAASEALLNHLGAEKLLVMAATHDLELTRKLAGYRNVHFREKLTGDGMVFTYKLMEGPSDTRNAIALMRQMGFPERIVSEAEGLAKG